jgi:hypothetical protein
VIRIVSKSVVLACVLAVVMLVPASASGTGLGRLHRERMEVGRALLEVQSTNWQSVLPHYTGDIEYHDPIVDVYGIDTMAEFLGRLFASTPDLVTTIEDETLISGVYSASWTMVGQFSGVPYSAKGISIMKFRDDSAQVYYQRDYYTEGDIMASIPGLDEAILGFRTFYRCAVDPTFDCPLGLTASEAGSDINLATDVPSPVDSADQERGRFWLRQRRLEIGRSLVEINAGNWQSLLQNYAADIEYHDPIVDIYGIETMAEFLGRLFASSPDLVTTVEDESLLGGVYTATWTMVGQFDGVPFSAKGMSLVKFRRRSTQVYYSRDYYTEGDIMSGIPGLDEAVAGFRVFYRCAVDPTFDCPLAGPEPLSDSGAESRNGASPSAAGFRLRQNAPNPFNPVTEIAFDVPDGGSNVSLRIFDVSGRLVRTLVDGFEPSGTGTLRWDGRDDAGHLVASGTYIYQLSAPEFSESRKMLLLK